MEQPPGGGGCGRRRMVSFRNAQSVLQLVRKQVNTHTHSHTQCTDAQTAAEMCLDIKQIVKNTAPPHGQIAFESEKEEETIFFIRFIILYASCIPNIPPSLAPRPPYLLS